MSSASQGSFSASHPLRSIPLPSLCWDLSRLEKRHRKRRWEKLHTMAERWGCCQPCWEGREGHGQWQLPAPAPWQPQGRRRVSHQRSLPSHSAAGQNYPEGTWSRSSGVCPTIHPLYRCHGEGKAEQRWGAGQQPGAKVAIAVLLLQHPRASSFLGSPFSFPLHMPGRSRDASALHDTAQGSEK